MDPITIAAAGMAVSGLVQLYNSEKARGAEQKRLNEIESLYNDLVPPDYDLSVQDPPELHTERLAQPEFSSAIAAPKWNLAKLSPEQFKQVGKLVPEAAPYIAEAAPQLVEKTKDMKTGRDAQLNALKRFMEVGAGDFDPEYQEAVTKASRQAQAEAQSRQQSILQDFARRGQSGSGLSLAAQMGGASQAMDREAMANMSAASDAYRNRLTALSQGASLGGQIQSDDTNLQARNSDIINSFNQRMAAGRQNWENSRAASLNNAQQYNLGIAQGLDNANVEARNLAARDQQSRQDDYTKYNTSLAQNQQARQDSNSKWGYEAARQERGDQNAMIQSQATWQAGERDRLNKIRSQMYQDQVDKAGMKAGVSNQRGALDISAAQDRNAAIQGLANAGATYAQSSAANSSARSGQLAADDRAYMEKNGSFMNDEERQKRQGYYNDYY
jgi:hypothetical protein